MGLEYPEPDSPTFKFWLCPSMTLGNLLPLSDLQRHHGDTNRYFLKALSAVPCSSQPLWSPACLLSGHPHALPFLGHPCQVASQEAGPAKDLKERKGTRIFSLLLQAASLPVPSSLTSLHSPSSHSEGLDWLPVHPVPQIRTLVNTFLMLQLSEAACFIKL